MQRHNHLDVYRQPAEYGPRESHLPGPRARRLGATALLLLLLCRPQFALASDLSNEPMESKVKAAPANIMLVWDNSGSMDFEFSTNQDDGLFWTNGHNYYTYGWYNYDVFGFNGYSYLYLTADNKYRNYYYQYPVLQSNERRYWKSQWAGFNRLYYNPDQTYRPWPGKANITLAGLRAVRSHPQNAWPTVDLTTTYLTVGSVNISHLHYYTSLNGVVYLVNLSGTTGQTRQYFRVNDANNNAYVDNGELILLTGTAIPEALKAKKTPSGGGARELMTVEEEALNMANWFGYYRRRSMAAQYAMSTALEEFTNVNVGFYTINDNHEGARIAVQSIANLSSLRSTLYGISSWWGTPLRDAFHTVGQYFAGTGAIGPSPFLSEDQGGACQQSFAILITDGYYNDAFASLGNIDDATKYSPPYGDTYGNTLADIAMRYYDTDLAANLTDSSPTNDCDRNSRQHLVTYAIAYGVEGSISLADIDGNKTADPAGCNYADDPYFLKTCTPKPQWPDPADSGNQKKIDDLWHATINGRGRFFSASNPAALVQSLTQITKDIKSRMASGASVAVNGDNLNDGSMLYQSTYDSARWTGDVAAYPLDTTTGAIKPKPLWQASARLDAKSAEERLIVSSNGATTGLRFSYATLTPVQQSLLGSAEVVDYLRGTEKAGMRARPHKLGDIVHSSPLLTGTVTPASATDQVDNDDDGQADEGGESVGGTIFVGANDGMLHAFNAQNGEERFAYIPSLVHDHLSQLTRSDYSHRFYVDATPAVRTIRFAAGDCRRDGRDNNADGITDEETENYSDAKDNDANGQTDEAAEKLTITMLVGGLGRGGRGYYGLDISEADQVTKTTAPETVARMVKWEYPRRYFDGKDNNGNGQIDEAAESSLFTETDYLYGPAATDGRDNNGDGSTDESGEKALFIRNSTTGQQTLAYRDDDLGYSYSTPAIVRSYRNKKPGLAENPWVVLFGNGYNSPNGHAVLYVLDMRSGELIRKIDTGVGGDNGLSSPVAADINDDARIDYVYAGDLKGNLWKFDLTAADPGQWRVAHSDKTTHAPCPLFSAPGQPITTKPDVMRHCKAQGYMVTFGTGKFLSDTDSNDTSQQTIFGIWDYGDPQDPYEYLGTWTRGAGNNANTLSNLPGVQLQPQVIVHEGYESTSTYQRILSSHPLHWYLEADTTTEQHGNPASSQQFLTDGADNDRDDRIDEATECDAWDTGTSTCLGHVDARTSEATGHAGWYFDLPGMKDKDGKTITGPSERMVNDTIIRDGRLLAVTFIPNASPCSIGGKSVFHELSACNGGGLTKVVLDISGDGKLDDADRIKVGIIKLAVTGLGIDGRAYNPAVLTQKGPYEKRYVGKSDATILPLTGLKEQLGLYYWREATN